MRERHIIEAKKNISPRPECLLQNQHLILEVMLDIRDLLSGKTLKIDNEKHSVQVDVKEPPLQGKLNGIGPTEAV